MIISKGLTLDVLIGSAAFGGFFLLLRLVGSMIYQREAVGLGGRSAGFCDWHSTSMAGCGFGALYYLYFRFFCWSLYDLPKKSKRWGIAAYSLYFSRLHGCTDAWAPNSRVVTIFVLWLKKKPRKRGFF